MKLEIDLQALLSLLIKKGVTRSREGKKEDIEAMRTHVINTIRSIDDMYHYDGRKSGLMTGFRELDEITTGLHGGDMIVVAAQPSLGKPFVMNVVENVAIRNDKPVPCAIFSPDMSSGLLVQRLLCSVAGVALKKVQGGFLSKSDFPRLMQAAGPLSEASIWIDDTPDLSIDEFQTAARHLKQQHDIQLIVIDYLQLLDAPGADGPDEWRENIAAVSAGIKSTAKELDIPIIAFVKYHWTPDSCGSRPCLSDLRDSGCMVEREADLVGFLLQSEACADEEEDEEENESAHGLVEFIIAKQHRGPLCEIPLNFDTELMRFDDWGRA